MHSLGKNHSLDLVNSSDIGVPITFGSGLPVAIPTRRTAVVQYGPPTIIMDPTISFPGVIATNPIWDNVEIINYGYGL